MKTLLVDHAPERETKDYNDDLENELSMLSYVDRAPWQDIADQPSLMDEYQLVVLSGNKKGIHGFEPPEDIKARYGRLKETGQAVLGICYGHQTMSRLFGGRVYPKMETGIGEMKVPRKYRDDPIVEGLDKRFIVDTEHSHGATKPKDFVIIAGSKGCRNQIMRHLEWPFYGMQFHPEKNEKSQTNAGRILLANMVQVAMQHENSRVANTTEVLQLESERLGLSDVNLGGLTAGAVLLSADGQANEVPA